MKQPKEANQRRRIGFMAALAIFTFLLGVFPFFAYAWGRVTGSIPGDWIKPEMIGNHGPWWDHWMGTFMFFSFFTLLLLPVFTVIAATVLFIRQRRTVIVFQGIALMIVQWGLAITHFLFGLWMVD